MNADDFKDFCEGGRYGGQTVLLQLKQPETFAAMLDDRREIQPAMLMRDMREEAQKQLKAMVADRAEHGEPPLTDQELAGLIAQIPPAGTRAPQMVPPVPLLLGTLELRGPLLLLRYVGRDGNKFLVSLCPDDVKHVTVAEATRIVT